MKNAAAVLAIGLGLLTSGCLSRDEVLRVPSPDGKVDPIVFETNCGVPCSFGYEVQLAPKGNRSGTHVASLDAATRNDNAWGVNLRWLDGDQLSVEYLRATDAWLMKNRVDIAGHNVRIELRGGVYDPRAPAGGMLYNLRGRRE